MSTRCYRGTTAMWILTGFLATVALGACAPKMMAKGATRGVVEEVKAQNSARPDGGPPPTQDLATNITRGTMNELDKPETREQLGRIMDTAVRSAVGSAVLELTRPRWGYQRWDPTRAFSMGPMTGPPTTMGPPTSVGPPRPATSSLEAIGPMGMLGGKMAEGFTLGMSQQLQAELGPDGRGPLGQTMAGVMKEATQAAMSGVAQELVPADCVGLDSRECADRRVRDLSRSAAKGFVDGLGPALQIPLLLAAFGAGVLGALVVFLLMRMRRPVLIATDAGSTDHEPQPHGT